VTTVEIPGAGRRARGARFLGSPAAVAGLVIAVIILFIVVAGPFIAPYPYDRIPAIPYQPPDRHFLLGGDYLGHDVLSRVLWGGRTVVGLAGLATLLAYLVGASIGLAAGYARSLLDPLLMRCMDVLLAFPPVLFLLVLATGAGPSAPALVFGVATVNVPGIARIVRAATLEASVRGYVEAAVARGEPTYIVLAREILPNIAGTLLADAGVRLTGSILLVASVNFLGLGLQPPTADWALMISENRDGLTIQPWSVAAPAILIALLTISTNLIADSFARSLGRSIDPDRGER
jgi:ABC-type dipeptide/oligopeptide/nickel transport system permease subunit